jgi:hypothetical protein
MQLAIQEIDKLRKVNEAAKTKVRHGRAHAPRGSPAARC